MALIDEQRAGGGAELLGQQGQMQGKGRLPAAKQSTSTSMSGARADPTPPSSAESRKRRAAAPPFRPPRRAAAPPFWEPGVHRLARGNLCRHSRSPAYPRYRSPTSRVHFVCEALTKGTSATHLAHLSRSTFHVPRPTLHIAHSTLHTSHRTSHAPSLVLPGPARGKGSRVILEAGPLCNCMQWGTIPAWTQLPALQP